MKSTLIKYLLLFVFPSVLFSCIKSNDWTEKERADFNKKCSETTIFREDPVCFRGFQFEEIDTIKVIEKNKLKKIDTFYIYPDKVRDAHDSIYKKHWADIERRLNVNNSYEFYLGKDKPYVLDNMEMIMWAQYTMMGEGWGCEMGNFTIDNEKFEGVGNIIFTKRGFKEKQY